MKTPSKPGSAERKLRTSVSITRLSPDNRNDFSRLHSGDHGWCQCVAWWVPTWEGWGERTADDNAELRSQLFSQNVHDGYLIHAGGELAGWCQTWRRDAFVKIQTDFCLPKDELAWMIGCFYIKPEFRKLGVARQALRLVVDALRDAGARSIDAFPKRGVTGDGELWNGPESTYLALGFAMVRDDPRRPVLRSSL